MAVSDQILEYIKVHGKASPAELLKSLDVSESSIHKNLIVLVGNGQLNKKTDGKYTIYTLAKQNSQSASVTTLTLPLRLDTPLIESSRGFAVSFHSIA